MRRAIVVVLVAVLAVSGLSAQDESLLEVSTGPYGSIPLGSSGELFGLGGGLDATATFYPARLRLVGLRVGGNGKLLSLETTNGVWTASGNAGVALRLPLNDRFSLGAHGGAGFYTWNAMGWQVPDEQRGGSYLLSGGAAATMQLLDWLSLRLGASFEYYADLYNGITIDLGVAYRKGFPRWERPERSRPSREVRPEPLEDGAAEEEKAPVEEPGEGLELRDIQLKPLFPVLYKTYDTNAVGTAVVKNFESAAAEDVRLRFYVERYMDNPMEIPVASTLAAGERSEVELTGLFTEDLMEVTEGTKASARITLTYSIDGETKSKEYTPVLEFHNRNALTWDDDRKVASFVTAKNPDVLVLSKNVMSWIQDAANPEVDENFQKAMAIFETLKAYGIRYEIDPTTPFSEYSENASAVDFLQFPHQTLQYTNGDCDDLSVLYTSLLEAAGVETAFITIPGHIYAAVALQAGPDEARRAFNQPDNLVFEDGKTWVPVEVTMCQESFDEAWKTGAKQWRENTSREQAALYPTREAWQRFQAVGFRESTSAIQLPDRSTVVSAFEDALAKHVEREIYPQVARLQSLIAQGRDTFKHENRLAVLYARHGLYDQALERLDEIIAERSYAPALVNAGNIHFIREEFESALSYYQRARENRPRNKTAILGVARCHHELENYGFVGKAYEELERIDPDLATRFAYLDLRGQEATRAADAAGLRDVVLWEEEE